MGQYIVLDLEWNQSPLGKDGSMDRLPFEIIEIGAVKLNASLQIISEFRRSRTPAAPTAHRIGITDSIMTGTFTALFTYGRFRRTDRRTQGRTSADESDPPVPNRTCRSDREEHSQAS